MDSEVKTAADVREGNPPVPAKGEDPKAPAESGTQPTEVETKANDRSDANKKPSNEKCAKKHSKRKSNKAKKATLTAEPSSESESDGSADGTTSSSSEDSESEAEASKKKRVVRKRQSPQKAKKKTSAKKSKKVAKTQHLSDSGSDSDSSDSDGTDSSDDEGTQRAQADLAKQLQLLLLQQQQQQQSGGAYGYPSGLNNSISPPVYDTGLRHNPPRPRRGAARPSGRANLDLGGIDPSLLLDAKQQKEKRRRQKATKLDYKRVDQVWDDKIHNYKLQDTAERTVDAQYDEFIFHVRRTFDWEGKYKATIVDIKSKFLRECLQDVIGDIKGISLVDDTPKLDPNMLFL